MPFTHVSIKSGGSSFQSLTVFKSNQSQIVFQHPHKCLKQVLCLKSNQCIKQELCGPRFCVCECIRKCVCVVVTICVMRMGTHLSKTVNEFCQCLRISINQGEQWPVGLGAVRDGLLATRQKETLQAERRLRSPRLSNSQSLYLNTSKMKWWLLKVNMELKFESNYFLIHIFIVLFLSQCMLFK